MKKFIIFLIFILTVSIDAYSQTLVTTFVDPCTKNVKLITIPLVGSTTVSLYNKSKSFTASDVASGELYRWISQAYLDWVSINPCSTNQATTTATQVASNTVSTVVANVISSPPPTPSVSTPATSSTSSSSSSSSSSSESTSSSSESSSSSSESSSESSSSSEEKSESKEESGGSKPKSKSSSSKAVRNNPILLNSDFTVAQNLDMSVNVIVSSGVSQSSLAGDESYGASTMIWSNLKQFAFNARYTKIKFTNGKLVGINNFSYTWVYSYGTMMGVIGYAYIKPLSWGIAGFNLSQITIGIPYQMGVFEDGTPAITSQSTALLSGTIFYTRSIPVNKKLNISPEIYITCNPFMFITRDHLFIKDYTLNFLSGFSGDLSITKRFKFNLSTKASFSTNKKIPILLNVLIGSKINI